MVLEYEFETSYIGYSEKTDEDYYNTETFEYETDQVDDERVAVRMVMLDMGCDQETAKKFVEKVLVEYGLLEQYLESDIDFVKDYFKSKAESLFYAEKEI